MKMATGVYNLDKWRRILLNMRPKALPNSNSKRATGTADSRKKKEGEANKKKLSNIVNKILASKSGEDFGGLVAGSDGERSDNSDNYNIYG